LNRLADVAVAGFGLVVTAPVLAVAAAAVKIADGGPVLYRQERVGKDGVPFELLKLRTMVVGAESIGAGAAVNEGDSRITRPGELLRKLSIDELPQLWNVLKGEMSLVGPRPERPEFVAEFKEKFPQYMLRHRVRSGMTGWAQVHGWRGNTSLAKRIEYDLFYIENWSLALDVRILWMTLVHDLRVNAH